MAKPVKKPHKILFVCLGNICRSPIAEGMFTSLVEEAGRRDEFSIDSAGTSGWHIGEPPDGDGQAAMRRRGIDISQQCCRQVAHDDFERFDLLIAMDDQNRRDLAAKVNSRNSVSGAEAKIRLLLDFAPPGGPKNVPDPWSRGPQAFEQVLELVEAGCIGLLASLPNRAK